MRNVILLFLLIVGWTTTVCAQNEQETIEVTGIVTDPKNEPLIGVNVTARNMPGFGAITDINGRYKIKVPNYSYLIFSYVGFTKQEIFIKDKKIINIVMAETACMASCFGRSRIWRPNWSRRWPAGRSCLCNWRNNQEDHYA